MVNRIDGNNYYEYTKPKNINAAETGEKFTLDYKQSELQAEAKEKKDKTEAGQDRKQTAEKGGVKLELSNSGKAANADTWRKTVENASSAAAKQPSLLETIQNLWMTAVSAIKDFFYKIWNDTEAENPSSPEKNVEGSLDSGQDGQPLALSEAEGLAKPIGTAVSAQTESVPQEAVDRMDSMDVAAAYRMKGEVLDREIQPYLRKGDLHQVINLLTDNGKKTIARNSSLLTYYDRNGRMIEPNASDKERILHGDRNTRKL